MNYALTITLKPCMYSRNCQEQYRIVTPHLEKILDGFKCSMIAELTKENNIHYHGMAFFKDHFERDRYINRFRVNSRMFGKKDQDAVANEPEWVTYINKDLGVTWELLGKSPIVRDDFKVFTNVPQAPLPIIYVPDETDAGKKDLQEAEQHKSLKDYGLEMVISKDGFQTQRSKTKRRKTKVGKVSKAQTWVNDDGKQDAKKSAYRRRTKVSD